jgi:hypothetical protein
VVSRNHFDLNVRFLEFLNGSLNPIAKFVLEREAHDEYHIFHDLLIEIDILLLFLLLSTLFLLDEWIFIHALFVLWLLSNIVILILLRLPSLFALFILRNFLMLLLFFFFGLLFSQSSPL